MMGFKKYQYGDGEIRTLAPLSRPTPLAGAPLQPLEYISMAPQVGLEPTTDRLTADSSTTELLWNNTNNLPGNVLLSRNVSPTTIGAKELNFCVQHGNRCDLFAIVTRQNTCLRQLINNCSSHCYENVLHIQN